MIFNKFPKFHFWGNNCQWRWNFSIFCKSN